MRLLHALLLPTLPLVLPTPALAEELTVSTTEGKLILTDRSNPPPVRPPSETLELAAVAPEGFPALPAGLTGVAYGTLDVRGESVALAVASSSEGTEDRVVLDADGDGTFGADEVQSPEFGERGETRGTTLRDQSLAVGGGEVAVFLSLTRRGKDQPWGGRLTPTWYRSGTFAVGEKTYVVELTDGDLDGAYDGEQDLWIVRPDGPVERSASTYSMQPVGGGTFADGHRFSVTAVAGDQVTLTATPAAGPSESDLAADRVRVEHVWAERFDDERERFVEQREVDTTRPRTATPVDWKYVTYAEARELAAASGKPLFVDVLAFWCVWCYRMDYYTYVDAEVARRLNEDFVPVKIIQEQDPAGDYAKLMAELELRGIPAMGVWSPDGELVHKISGWRKPTDFLAELATAEDAVNAGSEAPADGEAE